MGTYSAHLTIVDANFQGDLKTRKSTGTVVKWKSIFRAKLTNLSSCVIDFGSKFLVDLIFFTEHDYKVSASFIEENKRYKQLKTAQ